MCRIHPIYLEGSAASVGNPSLYEIISFEIEFEV